MNQEVAPPLAEGRYRLTEVLGTGGMAVVYRAWDTRLETARAIKVLKSEMDGRARERFDIEARTMARLQHPNVVMVHDVAEDGDRAYLVLELIEGGSISDRMAAFGPLPPKMAVEVTLCVLEGLAAAHAKGVVHRDVKPHNLMVSEDGVAKVTDFGIAQVSEFSSTKTGTAIGTWAYMAPEQRADAKAVDARADLFSVGCCLYNMLTGAEPFDLYNNELHDDLFAAVPEVFHHFIQKACRYKPEDRFQSAKAMHQALRELVGGLEDVPSDVPPLGVSLAHERADIVPTMVEGLPPSGISSPTIERPPLPGGGVSPKTGWMALAVAALVFLAAGAGLGLLVFMGVLGWSMTGSSDPIDSEIVVAAPASGPEDPAETPPLVETEPEGSALPEEPTVPMLAESDAPAAERAEPDAPAAQVTEPDAPAAEVTESIAPEPQVPATEPEPVAEPTPEPTQEASPAGTQYVSVNSTPWSTVAIDGGNFERSPFRYALPPGQYEVELANGEDPRETKMIRITVKDKSVTLCWDFHTDSYCPKR